MGIMINLDCDVFYHSRKNMADSVDEAYVRKYIDQYKDTSVSDIVFNVGGLLSSTPSTVRSTYADRALAAEQLAREKGEAFTWGCAPVVKRLNALGLDVYRIWIDRCRENGITPWISFRMNDCHNLFIEDDPLVPPEVAEHFADYSVVRHHRQIGWFDRCQDYALEAVRKRHLDYIGEQLFRYEPDGIELDFQRELNCFRPGFEWSGMEIMTGFMREVKAIVCQAEAKLGKKVKISVRCNQNPQYCMEWGFDIIQWARLGLMDVFVPSPRWNCTDTDIPVKLWKRILAPYGIPVIPGIDSQNIHPHPQSFMDKGHTVCGTVETTLAMAASFLTQGADGVYLFNYFNELPEEMITEENRMLTDNNSIFTAAGYYKVLMTAGDYDAVIQKKRRHMITYNDKEPLYRKNDAALPLTVGGVYNQSFHSNGECNPRYLHFATGTVPEGKQCTVRFGIYTEGFDVNDIEVYINCQKAEFAGTEEQGEPYFGISPVYGENDLRSTPLVYSFRVPREAIEPEVQVVEILLKEGREEKGFSIEYADLIVE